jgi:hypothetical protein
MVRVRRENDFVENGVDNAESTGDGRSNINYEDYENWLCGEKLIPKLQ